MNLASTIALRVWRDGAVRSLPLWLAITLLIVDVLALLIVFPVARDGEEAVPLYQLVLILWLPVVIFLALSRIRARSHRLDLALPISAHELWLTHTAATALSAAVVLAGGFGMLLIIDQLLERLDVGPDPHMALGALAVPITAATLLATVFVQRLQPTAWKPVGRAREWALMFGGLAVIPVALVVLEPWPAVSTLLFLGAVLLLARNTWTALPSALELTPLVEPKRAPRGQEGAATADRSETLAAAAAGGPLTVARLLFRILNTCPPWGRLMPWVLYFFLALVGFFLAGGFGVWVDVDESRLINLPLGTYMLFTGAGLLTYHLHRLDPLPISRRTLFRILVLPSLAIFALGWAAGRLVLETSAGPRQLLEYRIEGEEQWVQVAAPYMGLATEGEAPMLTAPWGESHRAWHRPLFRGGRLLLYSPFNTPEPTTARFEALMTSRAIERIFGETVPAAEIERRWFEVADNRVVGLRDEQPPPWAAYAAPASRAAVAGTPVFMTLTLTPWLLLLALFVRSFRATSSVRFVRWIYWAILLVLLSALVGQVVATLARLYSPDAAYGLLSIWLHRIESSPLAIGLAWAASLVLLYLSYSLAERGFRRAELPAAPLQCSLVDWSKGG